MVSPLAYGNLYGGLILGIIHGFCFFNLLFMGLKQLSCFVFQTKNNALRCPAHKQGPPTYPPEHQGQNHDDDQDSNGRPDDGMYELLIVVVVVVILLRLRTEHQSGLRGSRNLLGLRSAQLHSLM